ncbi:hypothetical protein [Kibdelosporangium phytohabitans]|uniref:Core-binding (CB) domain-containing protein n=1 Tax=Kibdelosporangium phytohabitans TaxID=860235 RepID=A0A0N9HQF8_9PSEU|nr:hypothetical protein [Kibdelosporangium phytohabitans]ALG06961.1 hypothetical protein AOZ06_08510 [Kibdelosporangium phytohabitans]MBE1468241.1 hypothetical protein [Kibdelosporangium phytohabitans]
MRYETDNGIASIPGFSTKKAADQAADDIEAQQRSEIWIDPAAGRTTLGTYVDQDWLDALDVGERTEENYRSKLKNHILPRWEDTPLTHITNSKARAWAKTLRHNGLAPVTASDTMKLLSLILSDAAEVEQRHMAALTTRWDEALNALRPTELDTTWRTAA